DERDLVRVAVHRDARGRHPLPHGVEVAAQLLAPAAHESHTRAALRPDAAPSRRCEWSAWSSRVQPGTVVAATPAAASCAATPAPRSRAGVPHEVSARVAGTTATTSSRMSPGTS